ncbi:YciI family protein [Haloechinothrix salitolerans]|uniref:YciI family protein n=1 Tax=Haloechinothrix salitolerans TaxID=926830 RepID=A0ABW2BSW7_9PSEU
MGRYMLIVKATADSEQGVMPSERELADMGAYNEKMVNAGVLVSGEGLHPSSSAARVTFSGGTAAVTEGPFGDPRTLVAGFWVLEVASREEAVSWARGIPFVDGEVEVRKIFEADDFGEEFTPELREQEERLRERVAVRHGG